MTETAITNAGDTVVDYHCKSCAKNADLIDELIEVLNVVDAKIHQRDNQAGNVLVSGKDIDELVKLLEIIEESVSRSDQKLCDDNGKITTGYPYDIKSVMASLSKTTHPSGTGYIPTKRDCTLHLT